MFYRVALQANYSSDWQWKSTALSSLDVLFQWLRLYQALPQDLLRLFSSDSQEGLKEQLVRENNGLESSSVTAEQFLHERKIGSGERTSSVSKSREQTLQEKQEKVPAVAGAITPWKERVSEAGTLIEAGISLLERRRLIVEQGVGGDYDSPYTFTLPIHSPLALAWMKLFVRVQNGELQP